MMRDGALGSPAVELSRSLYIRERLVFGSF